MLEVVITILLSLLLFSILYFSYTIIQKNVRRSKSDLTEILMFKQRLQIIFDQTDSISNRSSYLELHNVSGKNLIEFHDSNILFYKNNIADTLYTGQYSYFTGSNNESRLTDQLIIEFRPESPPDTIALAFSKNYLPAITLRRKEVDFEY